MAKVFEIVEVEKWVDGSGFEYSTTYSSQVVDVSGDSPEEIRKYFDWSWWDKEELADGEDLKITVKYYRPDYDPAFDDDEPIAKFETWESEI